MRGRGMEMDDSERLTRFEAVLAGLLTEQESVGATLEGLRAQGKTRTATYQQLTARKLALKSMLAAFEEQGLL